jgi:hypothetical protein
MDRIQHKFSTESVAKRMECYYPKNDEETRMVNDIAVVQATYPLADVIFGRTCIGNLRGFGVYENGRSVEGARTDLLGMGRTEEEAWYSAAKVIQQLMLRELAR